MDYSKIAQQSSIDAVTTTLTKGNIAVHAVATKQEALQKIKELIPENADVMTGSSRTLDEIGFTDLLKSGTHTWHNVKEAILKETDPNKQTILRKQSVLASYFLGSVHAVAETGEVVIASASGSQIPSYAFTSDNVIWVVGAQKIVPTYADAIHRLETYVFPLENERMKSTGAPGSSLSMVLTFHKSIMPNRHIHMIIVNETLGF